LGNSNWRESTLASSMPTQEFFGQLQRNGLPLLHIDGNHFASKKIVEIPVELKDDVIYR
jgi:hypothetical protein